MTTTTVKPIRVSVTDTARMIRTALKEKFGTTYPTTKFSVKSKSYSGGASVSVSWTDGPTDDSVSKVVGVFSGASFDGMIDLKSYHNSTYKGTLYSFGADYVFTHRKLSTALLTKAAKIVSRQYGTPMPTIAPEKTTGPITYSAYVVGADFETESRVYQQARTMKGA